MKFEKLLQDAFDAETLASPHIGKMLKALGMVDNPTNRKGIAAVTFRRNEALDDLFCKFADELIRIEEQVKAKFNSSIDMTPEGLLTADWSTFDSNTYQKARSILEKHWLGVSSTSSGAPYFTVRFDKNKNFEEQLDLLQFEQYIWEIDVSEHNFFKNSDVKKAKYVSIMTYDLSKSGVYELMHFQGKWHIIKTVYYSTSVYDTYDSLKEALMVIYDKLPYIKCDEEKEDEDYED